MHLEVLLVVEETRAVGEVCELVAQDVQLRRQSFWTAEEHTNVLSVEEDYEEIACQMRHLLVCT